MILMMIVMLTLMMIVMTKPYDYADSTDDDHDHKNDNYTAAGAAPDAGAAPGSWSESAWDLKHRSLRENCFILHLFMLNLELLEPVS